MTPLVTQHCRPLSGSEHRLDATQSEALLAALDGWQIDADYLFKEFCFADHKTVMLFVNAVAWLAERENHHPDLAIGEQCVVVSYCTRDVGGLSYNDFICAAKIEALTTI